MNGDVLVSIRPARDDEMAFIFSLITEHDEWTQFNAPYFSYTHPSLQQFADTTFKILLSGLDMQLITVNDVPVGTVNCYWECEATRWLEAGIVIYDPTYWGIGIAAVAIPLWITNLFQTRSIERVGMTTWSGNQRMMSLAHKIGLKEEARLRKVRYYRGTYYDSMKYGILRSEWEHLQLHV